MVMSNLSFDVLKIKVEVLVVANLHRNFFYKFSLRHFSFDSGRTIISMYVFVKTIYDTFFYTSINNVLRYI